METAGGESKPWFSGKTVDELLKSDLKLTTDEALEYFIEEHLAGNVPGVMETQKLLDSDDDKAEFLDLVSLFLAETEPVVPSEIGLSRVAEIIPELEVWEAPTPEDNN